MERCTISVKVTEIIKRRVRYVSYLLGEENGKVWLFLAQVNKESRTSWTIGYRARIGYCYKNFEKLTIYQKCKVCILFNPSISFRNVF